MTKTNSSLSPWVIAIILVLTIGLLAVWLTPNLLLRSKYENLRETLNSELGPPFLVKPFDAAMQKQLAVIESSWQHHKGDDGGSVYYYSNAMRTAGIDPTVDGLIHFFNYRMPEFSWISLKKNQHSLSMGALQAVVFPHTLDSTIHVSPDRQVAIIRYSDSFVMVLRKDKKGLSETMWVDLRKSSDQDKTIDADGP